MFRSAHGSAKEQATYYGVIIELVEQEKSHDLPQAQRFALSETSITKRLKLFLLNSKFVVLLFIIT